MTKIHNKNQWVAVGSNISYEPFLPLEILTRQLKNRIIEQLEHNSVRPQVHKLGEKPRNYPRKPTSTQGPTSQDCLLPSQ